MVEMRMGAPYGREEVERMTRCLSGFGRQMGRGMGYGRMGRGFPLHRGGLGREMGREMSYYGMNGEEYGMGEAMNGLAGYGAGDFTSYGMGYGAEGMDEGFDRGAGYGGRRLMQNEEAQPVEERLFAEAFTGGDEARKQVNKLMDCFPALKAEEIPQTVWQRVRQGQDLALAYCMWRMEQLETMLAQRYKNAAMSAGSMTSMGNPCSAGTLAGYWDAYEI